MLHLSPGIFRFMIANERAPRVIVGYEGILVTSSENIVASTEKNMT
jgi:hypothetical protein